MNAIVVGTDGSPGAEAAVGKVIELVQGSVATEQNAELIVRED